MMTRLLSVAYVYLTHGGACVPWPVRRGALLFPPPPIANLALGQVQAPQRARLTLQLRHAAHLLPSPQQRALRSLNTLTPFPAARPHLPQRRVGVQQLGHLGEAARRSQAARQRAAPVGHRAGVGSAPRRRRPPVRHLDFQAAARHLGERTNGQRLGPAHRAIHASDYPESVGQSHTRCSCPKGHAKARGCLQVP